MTGVTILALGGSAAEASAKSWAASNLLSPQVIASVVAAAAAFYAAYTARRVAANQQKSIKRERQVQFCLKQLNDLYGQIYMLRKASSSLYDAFHEGSRPDGWRLVDHIEEVWNSGDSGKIRIIKQILEINHKIEDLLISQSGLLTSFPPPDSFQKFISHSRQLRIAWAEKENLKGGRISFPRDIDQDILAAIEEIRGKLSQLDSESK